MINHPVLECEKELQEMAQGCPACDRVFDKKTRNYSDYKKHIASVISCEICGENYHGIKGLYEHKSLAHNEMIQKSKCQYCDEFDYDLKRKV